MKLNAALIVVGLAAVVILLRDERRKRPHGFNSDRFDDAYVQSYGHRRQWTGGIGICERPNRPDRRLCL